MDLWLWRHAQAQDGVPDSTRALTDKGVAQAKEMAGWLHARLPQSTRILVSPATRAQQTAAPLAAYSGRHIETVPGLAPGATVHDVLRAADWPSAANPVLVVGHQPTLGFVASALLVGSAQPWSVQKGAVWWLRARVRDGAQQVVLRAVMYPDLV